MAFPRLRTDKFISQSKAYQSEDKLLDSLVEDALTPESDEITTRSISQETPAAKTELPKGVLWMMTKNLNQIQDYYSISKNQARQSFRLAVINCIAGLILLCLAANYAITAPKPDAAILYAVAGAIAEAFAGTSLIVHRKSLTQLNHYYDALHEIEMFLSTVQLIGYLNPENQDSAYLEVIRNELKVRYETAVNKSLRALGDKEDKIDKKDKPQDKEEKPDGGKEKK